MIYYVLVKALSVSRHSRSFILVYAKPVNSVFRALWLATQARDIHWTCSLNTMDARARNHLSSRHLTRQNSFFVAAYSLVSYILKLEIRILQIFPRPGVQRAYSKGVLLFRNFTFNACSFLLVSSLKTNFAGFPDLFLQPDHFDHDVWRVAVLIRVGLLYQSFSPLLLKMELSLALVRFLCFLLHFIHSGTVRKFYSQKFSLTSNSLHEHMYMRTTRWSFSTSQGEPNNYSPQCRWKAVDIYWASKTLT